MAGKAPAEHGSGLQAGADYLAFSLRMVLIAVSLGMVLVSAQSPPPTPKSRRLTVALPVSTGCAPAAQVKVNVTGLLTPRSSSVPSAAYWLLPNARKPLAV